MISVEAARTGQMVLKKDGRWLGSSIDPLREAATWAEKCSSVGFDNIIVLGLGTGYHVVELASKRNSGSVIVVENDMEIVAQALKLNQALRREDIVIEPEWMKLVASERFRDAVCSSYFVAPYAPSCQLESEFYGNVQRLLLGRDKLSFLLLLKTRPELLALLNPSAINDIQNDEAISIKTLQKIFSASSVSSRERRMWRVLEELVL